MSKSHAQKTEIEMIIAIASRTYVIFLLILAKTTPNIKRKIAPVSRLDKNLNAGIKAAGPTVLVGSKIPA